jgi:hypothetical protein
MWHSRAHCQVGSGNVPVPCTGHRRRRDKPPHLVARAARQPGAGPNPLLALALAETAGELPPGGRGPGRGFPNCRKPGGKQSSCPLGADGGRLRSEERAIEPGARGNGAPTRGGPTAAFLAEEKKRAAAARWGTPGRALSRVVFKNRFFGSGSFARGAVAGTIRRRLRSRASRSKVGAAGARFPVLTSCRKNGGSILTATNVN